MKKQAKPPRYVAEQVGPYDWEVWDTVAERWVRRIAGDRETVEAEADRLNAEA